ncbi:MAG: bifunctional glutamate N-acetyltransferase/amino-acid acetyltransferase ArgJ [Gemmatimonadales bacterium]|nr:MAG: bifunctional glutamate N-acetyltransferase/amino-acid acetyltransferase ArgJ [Gemmatimonadales bacterium]
MTRHETPRLPSGFRCAAKHCGIKAAGDDLALFYCDRMANAAGLLTRNHFPGAPILLARERLKRGLLRGVVVNSGVSNVATGARGIDDARRMAAAAAAELDVDPAHVLVGSTGVIGRPLPIERVEAGIRGMAAEAGSDPLVGARGIMTTDRVPKAFSLEVEGATVSVVGKGAGMIAPNMATMLVYFFTDAEASSSALREMLWAGARDSFQVLSVDTDTSTSDMVVAMASGAAGPVSPTTLAEAFAGLSEQMAEAIARDGEGATRLLRVTVGGAVDEVEARRIARSVAESPLVKTMIYGRDPNVGRILMAVGKCVECRIQPDRVQAELQGMAVIRDGLRADFDETTLRERLGLDTVEIRIDLGVGSAGGRALGCDLTEGYIEENTAYASS